MRARLPEIDFSAADALWFPAVPEFGHRMNGASLLLPYLEPYLIRVMKWARPRIAEVAPELLADLDIFNRQEANHFKLHAAYNQVMREQYPGLEPFEAEIKADFQHFLKEKSLAWNLAYCEGFESTGLISSEFYLQEIDDLLASADPAVAELWSWHLAEEFEHRNVCHDVLKALYPGYRRRLAGFRYCGNHLFSFSSRVREHMLAIDAERGRVRNDATQHRALASFQKREKRFQMPLVRKILMPWYNPHPRPLQPQTQQVLASYETARPNTA